LRLSEVIVIVIAPCSVGYGYRTGFGGVVRRALPGHRQCRVFGCKVLMVRPDGSFPCRWR
jgi:hypothetical protein